MCYSSVRNMLGYTGTYRGERVSVQGTGMGQPSLAIYVTELIREYGVAAAGPRRVVRLAQSTGWRFATSYSPSAHPATRR